MLQSIYTHAGCDYGCLYTYSPRHCFNPHTHAGCDDVTVYFSVSAKVSIHTPTQGVTQSITSTKLIKIVSIHTPTQGVTYLSFPSFQNGVFQSTHPRRVWQGDLNEKFAERVVSIHTPTQGVTTYGYIAVIVRMFQSTHPRRVWLMEYFHNTRVIGFNPHTHAGCDVGDDKRYERMIFVSIHTPTQGVTKTMSLIATRLQFQSTHPRRVWRSECRYDVQRESFNPHTHAGCDKWLLFAVYKRQVSIHTPTQGVTTINASIYI